MTLIGSLTRLGSFTRRLLAGAGAVTLCVLAAAVAGGTTTGARASAAPAPVPAPAPAASAAVPAASARFTAAGPGPAGPGGGGPERGDRAWPVAGARGGRPLLVRVWRPPPVPWAAGHRGVDLVARPGQAVRAAAPGTVSFAGTVAGRGVVAVKHAGTGDPPLRTTYEPVNAVVKEGDEVAAGQVIGTLQAGPSLSHCLKGAGGASGSGACLHWGLLRGKIYLDPLSLLPPWMLRRPPSRLLPLVGGAGTAVVSP
ncbi:M23 family metallopeptidase [Streptomyces roseoverticillatus]|uniref:murein hydrolase activator EnvC family protein n=1 Tax=Streptomyces roseoverticillatus TaxID=66429 RepID=UPI001F368658|nr:M23 family metallopeptidase [Streptomyces roseoverticillatus]MCF3105870.1 M23 family metallopeptidase [Streptomyces roseoverticillatus]